MTIRQAIITITGTNPLLTNNPQTVDPFNKYAKAKKAITAKRTSKTEDDMIELMKLEVESKVFWSKDLGAYVPTAWMTEAICRAAFGVAKIGKDKMRGGFFPTTEKAKLHYRDMEKVKELADIVENDNFRHSMILPQQQVRVCKAFPIFHDWSFSVEIEFDDEVVDLDALARIASKTAKYVGFGDFRPTFGRANAEVREVK